MFGDVYDDIVQEQRDRMLGLAEHFGWPDEVNTIFNNIEGYKVGCRKNVSWKPHVANGTD